MTVVPAYRCDWCRKKSMRTKSAMARHEAACFCNPDRRACQTCANFGTLTETQYVPSFINEVGDCDVEYEVAYCEAGVCLKDGKKCDCPLWKPTELDAGEGVG